jgi:hypothetical protein
VPITSDKRERERKERRKEESAKLVSTLVDRGCHVVSTDTSQKEVRGMF